MVTVEPRLEADATWAGSPLAVIQLRKESVRMAACVVRSRPPAIFRRRTSPCLSSLEDSACGHLVRQYRLRHEFSRLMLRCGGNSAIHNIVAAMSSPVIGFAPCRACPRP